MTVIDVAGVCQLYNLFCPYCREGSSNYPTVYFIPPDRDWLLRLQCSFCKKEWAVCTKCSGSTKRYMDKVSILRHERRSHPRSHPKPSQPGYQPNMDSPSQCFFHSTVSTTPPVPPPPQAPIPNHDVTCDTVSLFRPNNNETILEAQESSSVAVCPLTSFPNANHPEIVNFSTTDYFSTSTKQFFLSLSKTTETQRSAIKYYPVNERNLNYFLDNLEDNKGLQSLISNSHKRPTKRACVRSMSPKEMSLHISLSKFCNSLTNSQQTMFSSVMRQVDNVFVKKNMMEDRVITNLPTQISSLRRIYIDGKHSMNRNLPKPEVTMLEHHSYVHLMDCISDILGHGKHSLFDFRNTELPENDSLKNDIFTTNSGSRIIEQMHSRHKKYPTHLGHPIIVVLVILWSDDFEPNKSVKCNRQSVWIKTATFILKDMLGNNHTHTFPISLGKKKIDHDEVEKLIWKDLYFLHSGEFPVMLSTVLKKPVHVHGQCYVVLNDQPERRSSLKLSAGNSIHHRRWNYVSDLDQCRNKLRACSSCCRMIKEEIKDVRAGNITLVDWRLSPCQYCSRWMYDIADPLLHFTPVKDFDQRYSDVLLAGKVVPCKLNRMVLYNAFRHVHEKMKEGFLDKKQGLIHLQTFCFSTGLAEKLVDNASHCHLFYVAEVQRHTDPDQYKKMCEEKAKNPQKYEKASLPAAWSYNSDFSKFTDVPMHLLFLGVTRSTVSMIQVWMKKLGLHTRFCNSIQSMSESIKILGLPWCKMLAFSDQGFGGWVSENYLAFSRLMPWFYSVLHRWEVRIQYTEPSGNRMTWSHQDNFMWLKVRGLETDGSNNDVRNRVRAYQLMPESVCPTVIQNAYGVPDIFEVIKSLTFLLECLMSPKKVDQPVRKLEALVRQFLSAYAALDDYLDPQRKQPSWITKYNFLSLLNLPEQVHLYGSVRNIWEGGVQGEGFLRQVKSQMKTGTTYQWEKWLLDKLLVQAGYKNISTIVKSPVKILGDVKIYKNLAEALYCLQSFRPFSAALMHDENKSFPKIWILYYEKKEINGFQIQMTGDGDSMAEGFDYYFVSRSNDETINFSQLGITDFSPNINYMFLPNLVADGFPKRTLGTFCKYTYITSDWNYGHLKM